MEGKGKGIDHKPEKSEGESDDGFLASVEGFRCSSNGGCSMEIVNFVMRFNAEQVSLTIT